MKQLFKILTIIPIVFLSSLKADMIVATGEANITIARMKAASFLKKATMGASYSDVVALGDRVLAIGDSAAYNEWLNNQRSIPKRNVIGHHYQYINYVNKGMNARNQEQAWWDYVTKAPDQLRFKAAHVWSQIMPASLEVAANNKLAGLQYWEVLYNNALGKHKDMLHDVTYSTTMGVWLSHLHNMKGNESLGVFADENYARELMQLFTIGIYALNINGDYILDSEGNPVENFNNEDIEEVAKVFTGFHFDNGNRFLQGRTNYYKPMLIDPAFHDVSEKNIFGNKFPAGRDGYTEVDEVLSILTKHPSCAPFIARELIKRYSSANPSNQYVGEVAKTYRNTGGDLYEVIKHILLKRESRKSLVYKKKDLGNGTTLIQVEGRNKYIGVLQDPVLVMTNHLRYQKVSSPYDEGFIVFKAGEMGASYSRRINAPTTVFFDYSTWFAPGEGPLAKAAESTNLELVSPASQLLSKSFTGLMNIIGEGIQRRGPRLQYDRTLSADFPVMQYMEQNDWSFDQIFDRFNLVVCGGSIPRYIKNNLKVIIAQESDKTQRFLLTHKALMHLSNVAVVY